MAVKWTKEQRQVIDLRDRNILVSAAAGSGIWRGRCTRRSLPGGGQTSSVGQAPPELPEYPCRSRNPPAAG